MLTNFVEELETLKLEKKTLSETILNLR